MRALPYDSLKSGGTSASPARSVLKLSCAKPTLTVKINAKIPKMTATK